MNFDDSLNKQMKDPEFKKEYDALDSPFCMPSITIS